MREIDQSILSNRHIDALSCPLLICLLGNFRLLHTGCPVTIPCGGKIETLLARLGLQFNHRVHRSVLLDLLWPASDSTLAQQSLNSLVYSLHKLIGDALGGAAAILHEDGYYRLNKEAGVSVDVASFDAWADMGDQQVHAWAADLRRGGRRCAGASGSVSWVHGLTQAVRTWLTRQEQDGTSDTPETP